jgi:hypothetical protein
MCGVDEALNETAFGAGLVARGVHKIILSSVDNAASVYREEEMRSFYKPQYAFSATSLSAKKWFSGHRGRVRVESSLI